LGLFYLFVWFQTQNRQNEKTRQAREERDHFEPAGGRKKNEFLVMHASELQTRAKEKKRKITSQIYVQSSMQLFSRVLGLRLSF
jgi:hypothetical protein